MTILNLEVLESLMEQNSSEQLNDIFQILATEVKSHLNLDVIDPNIKVELKLQQNLQNEEVSDIFNFGVKKYFKGNILIIELNQDLRTYFPVILLREVYYCFIPSDLTENRSIQIIVNLIIENDLRSFSIIKEWKELFRQRIVDYDYLNSQFDRMEGFLELQEGEKTEKPSVFFFEFIKRNVLLIKDYKGILFDLIFEEYVLKNSRSLQNDEIVETLRILIIIFYEIKSYKALLDYKKYFQDFKKKGKIQTELSLRKFTTNMQWINKCSYIAPSYQINYNALNLSIILCIFEFNPLLSNEQVVKFIESLPFFVNSKSSNINFGINVSGWFNIPHIYIKDLIIFLDKLEENGFIIKKTCFTYERHQNHLNLNYFREYFDRKKLINPNHRKYNKKYEIKFEFSFGEKYYTKELSILDYLILDRIRYWSVSGFSFERRVESLRTLKSDYFNEILSQQALIKELKNSLEIIHETPNIKDELLVFINSNLHFGFFYIRDFLEKSTFILDLINDFLSKNPDINNPNQFYEFIKKSRISQSIENNLILRKNDINKNLFRDIVPLYFSNKNKFMVQTKNYHTFLKLFKTISSLKIFDLQAIIRLIKDKNLVNQVYSEKESRLKRLYEKKKLQEITSNDINNILDNFISNKPPVIIPLLISTINTTSFSKYYIQFILRKSSVSIQTLEKIKKFFPRVIVNEGRDIFTKILLMQVEMYVPNINAKEKEIFFSILGNLFKDDLIVLKRYFWDGFFQSFSRKDFYDFENKEFFYTSDLFNQYFIFSQKIFGNNLTSIKENSEISHDKFLSSDINMINLVSKIQDRKSREQIDFKTDLLNDLVIFHSNIEKSILKQEDFRFMKNQKFFKTFIQAIKFKPSFQSFGLGEYFLYICPSDSQDLDFKLLFGNNFKKVEYPAYIESNKSLFIKYIFPYRNPNLSYVNWLSKSKRIIREYCLFFVKKIYQLLHFDYSLTSEGWNLDPNRFKTYMQKILFDPSFKFDTLKVKVMNTGDLQISNSYGANSIQFKNLAKISGWKSLDIKSIIGSKNYSLTEKIMGLIQNKLIFPYLKLKNLGLIEKILIILPNVKKELNDTIIKIFNFFNFGFISEIEGHYFIKGLVDEVRFENGLFIKLYLPNTDFSEFQQIFSELFQFLKIKKYLIFSDMVDGNNLIKNVYRNLDFLESYNPLKNLIWNKKDQRWMNHKLFGENFEPIYPDLT